MATITTCPDHPGDRMQVLDEMLEHVRMFHPSAARTQDVLDRMETRVVRRTPDLRIFMCRRCTAWVETRDPDTPPYCDDCRADA